MQTLHTYIKCSYCPITATSLSHSELYVLYVSGYVWILLFWRVTQKSNCPPSGWVWTQLAAGQPSCQWWINDLALAPKVWWLMPVLINPITESNNSWRILWVWHPSIYQIVVFAFLPALFLITCSCLRDGAKSGMFRNGKTMIYQPYF